MLQLMRSDWAINQKKSILPNKIKVFYNFSKKQNYLNISSNFINSNTNRNIFSFINCVRVIIILKKSKKIIKSTFFNFTMLNCFFVLE